MKSRTITITSPLGYLAEITVKVTATDPADEAPQTEALTSAIMADLAKATGVALSTLSLSDLTG